MSKKQETMGNALEDGHTLPEEVPEGYKRTEVGVIPEDWCVSTIGAEFRTQLGKMLDAAKNTGVPKPYIGNRSVQWGRIALNGIATVPMSMSDLQRFRLRRGDLLVCEGGEIGRAAIWNDLIPECYYQKAIHRLRPVKTYNVYLMMCLLQLWTSNGYLSNYVTQTSIAHLPKDKLEIVPLPVPPDAEQQAIAEALSDVDGLLAALEALIAKKRAIKQAAMQQLLTGKTRLPGFSGKWKTKRIGDLIYYERPDHYIVQSTDYSEYGDVPVLTANKSFVLGYTDENFGVCTEVPVIIFDDFTTDCKYAKSPFKVKSSAIKLLRARQNQAHLRYLFERMQLIHFPLGDHKRYYISDYQNIELSVPDFSEQKALASILSDLDAEIAALEQRRDKAHAIKQGMMQQLLTGQVRLIKPTCTKEASAC